MTNIYCIYTDSKKIFEVLEIEIKEETEKLYLFEYQKQLGSGQFKKELINKIYRLRNDRGTVIVCENKKLIPEYLKLLAKKETAGISQKQNEMMIFKQNIKSTARSYQVII